MSRVKEIQQIGTIKPLSLIIAVDEEGGFGREGKIPWNYPDDLKHFKKVTNGSACIMGRKTYYDMFDITIERKGGKKKKPVHIKEILPGRESYVLSKTIKEVEGAIVKPTLRSATETTKRNGIFVIGGDKVFTEALPWVNRIYMSVIKGKYNCDKFFDVRYLTKNFKLVEGKETRNILFMTYQRK